ncbi:AsmA-like C-terminal region-containing protein [Roseiconus nitratireducens]|uniref:AsmA-like C-terminal region-containing protein n=1 Tax=Roseiconus nitratireducens TaxID=2605748 RepID=UPI001375C837|nr:AsmA-like C-terminal region-containing protein [Roseiconus nitratireducens]
MIARVAIIQIGSRFLPQRIGLESIAIEWHEIQIRRLEVFEPKIPDERQLTIDRIRVVPSFWQGCRSGVWIEEVVIQAPTAEVRFDADGNLLSVFPEAGESAPATGPVKIPVARVTVQDATLIVHQTGRDSLKVSGVDIRLSAKERIRAKVAIGDFLGCKCTIKSDLDAQSFAGISTVDIGLMHLDTVGLNKLPLMPSAIATYAASANFGLKLVARHPADEIDPRKHDFCLRAWTTNVQADLFGTLCDRLDLVVTSKAGKLGANLNANPLGGSWKLLGSVDLIADKPEGVFESSLQDCQPAAMAKALPALEKLRTDAAGWTKWNFVLDDGTLRFQGDLTADAQHTQLDDHALPGVRADIDVAGDVRLDDLKTLHGSLRGALASEPFDLRPIAKSFGVQLKSGSVIAHSDFTIPLETIENVDTFEATARLATSDLATQDVQMDPASIITRLAEGVVTINLNDFALRDVQKSILAEIQSETTIALARGGQLASRLQFFVEPSIELVNILGLEKLDPSGRLVATATASCPTTRITIPADWTADTRIQTKSLSVAGESLSDIDWQASLSNGNIRCDRLEARWREHTLVANASAGIGSTVQVQGDVALDALRLADISEVLTRYSQTRFPLDGFAGVNGSFAFTLDMTNGQQSLDASGSATLRQASYALTKIGEATLDWTADFDGLTISTCSPDFLNGRFDVEARIEDLDWTRTRIQGTFSGLEASRFVGMVGQDLPTTGILDGGFRVTSIADLESLSGEAWLASKQLSVKRVPMQINRATIAVDCGELRVDANGSLVSGDFDAQASGSLPQLADFFATKSPPIAKVPLTAEVSLTGLRAETLVRVLGMPREAQSLTAILSAHCTRDSAAWDGRYVCTASASVENLGWNRQGLSQRISAETVLHPDRLELTGIRGRFAEAALSGSGEVMFDRSPVGRFDLSATHINLRRASSPFGVKGVSGTGSVLVRGRIGSEISGKLDVTIDNLAAAGVAVRKAVIPVDWSYRPAGGLARWKCRAGTVSIGGGSLLIASEGSYSSGVTSTSSVRVENIDLTKLMRNGSVGSGTVSGTANIRTRNARAAEDLVGSFAMEMKNIQAMQIPVLDQLPKMITLSPPVPGRGQDGGTVHGRIAGGLVHLDEVAIHQSNVQLMVSGNATMSGRLDLDVVASTESTSPTDQLVSLLDSPVMLAAPAPVALVVKANELLKDRVVRVHVGGTADRPTLRLQPGKQLSQDAVRFFLSSSLPSAANRLTEIHSQTRRR